jgi:ATP synthase protein I
MAREERDMPDPFATDVGRKASRRLRARHRDKSDSLWFGLGTFGMVGWSIAIPTVIGVVVGTWLDANVPASFSWRLTLLFLGLVVGCLNAWYWISSERQLPRKERHHNQDE